MTKEKRALLSLQANFDKYATQIEKQENSARECNHQIELKALELLRNTFFRFRFDVEKELASLGLNEFCGLSVFKEKKSNG